MVGIWWVKLPIYSKKHRSDSMEMFIFLWTGMWKMSTETGWRQIPFNLEWSQIKYFFLISSIVNLCFSDRSFFFSWHHGITSKQKCYSQVYSAFCSPLLELQIWRMHCCNNLLSILGRMQLHSKLNCGGFYSFYQNILCTECIFSFHNGGIYVCIHTHSMCMFVCMHASCVAYIQTSV